MMYTLHSDRKEEWCVHSDQKDQKKKNKKNDVYITFGSKRKMMYTFRSKRRMICIYILWGKKKRIHV
jgi:hypothetical protein